MQRIISINYSITVFFTNIIADTYFQVNEASSVLEKNGVEKASLLQRNPCVFLALVNCHFVLWKQKDKKYYMYSCIMKRNDSINFSLKPQIPGVEQEHNFFLL